MTGLSIRSASSPATLLNPIPVSTIRSRSRPLTYQMLQRISSTTCGSIIRIVVSSIRVLSNQRSATGSGAMASSKHAVQHLRFGLQRPDLVEQSVDRQRHARGGAKDGVGNAAVDEPGS